MHRLLSTLVVAALMAATAMTAPTPTKTISKRSFQAKAKGHGKPSPKEAMQRAAQKYGFKISVPESDIKARHWDHDRFSQNSENPWSWLSAILPGPSASASGTPEIIIISSGVPALSASGLSDSSSSFPFPSGSAIPSSGGLPFPSGSAIPSSGSPPAQSSAQSSAQPSAQPSSATLSSPAPSSSSSSGGKNESGSVSADPSENDSMYLSQVTIGGSQTLDLDFDTGSVSPVFSRSISADVC
jgi:hypothetical protein